jgi:hypothetical protein
MIGAALLNIFGLRLLSSINKAAIFWWVPAALFHPKDLQADS